MQVRVKWKEVSEEANNDVAPEEEEDEEARFRNNSDISLYSGFIMATYCVFCAVGTEFLYIY